MIRAGVATETIRLPPRNKEEGSVCGFELGNDKTTRAGATGG